jgi:putative acetyltransferase
MILWCDPAHPGLQELLEAQQREIIAAEGDDAIVYPLHGGIQFVLASLNGVPVACGALQPLEPGVAEVKRMYVRPDHRGRGLSRAILAAIEARAARTGVRTLRLETGRGLPAALKLYGSSGYTQIPSYGEYVGNPESVCFEKRLTGVTVGVTP